MEEKEVIRMLKEHILHCIQDHGKLTKFDKGYCLRYIMDFVFYDSADNEKVMTKKAEKFLREKVLVRIDIPSESFENTKYIVVGDCVVVDSQDNGMLCISKKSIAEFIRELKRMGEAI